MKHIEQETIVIELHSQLAISLKIGFIILSDIKWSSTIDFIKTSHNYKFKISYNLVTINL